MRRSPRSRQEASPTDYGLALAWFRIGACETRGVEPTDDLSEAAGGSFPSQRTRVRRHPERGHYDAATVKPILDEGFICHVAFSDDRGPVVVPTSYARVGDALYLHGAAGNAALRALTSGAPVCVAVTLVDGLVLARSAFHHSINYRSVVIFGAASEVTDLDEKRRALDAVVEHLAPGRGRDARGADDAAMRATRVVRIPLDEASAKVRAGGPLDDPADMDLPVWAGQIPLRLVADPPIADETGAVRLAVPEYAARYTRPALAGPGAPRR
jgi:nitroimidazol reductase NimA-like FMN-containing flavoprotein (pyridoxamine 5'-phosphate oxidase superfamily)